MFSSPRPPKFGSRLDFERAILEVKWLGRNEDDNIRLVANKYNFPPEFIRAGISGLKQEDYLIRSSKWWPIIAQWDEQADEVKFGVMRAVAYTARAGSNFIIYIMFAIGVIIELFFYGGYSLAIPGITVTIGLFIALYRRGEDWNLKAEEEIHRAEFEGYKNIAQDFIQLAKENPRLAYSTFKRLSKERSRKIVVEYKNTEVDKKGNITPVFNVLEEVDAEYAKRVQELE